MRLLDLGRKMTSRCQIIEQNTHCDNYILMYDYIYDNTLETRPDSKVSLECNPEISVES